MAQTIIVQKGSDRAVHVPHDEVGPGWAAVAEVREWPSQEPPVQSWSTRTGSALAEQGELILFCDRSRDWSWRFGELTVSLTAPDGSRDVTTPTRIRLR